MAAELAASERLNYLSKKQRAVSSRHSRQIISATNGAIFSPGQQTVIQIAGGQSATYWDFQNSYLKVKVNNNKASASNDTTKIGIGSVYDLISRLEILADGQTLSNIEEYGALVRQYQRLEVGGNWTAHIGEALTGVSNNLDNVVELQGQTNRTFCFPLVLTPLFNVNKYIPLIGRSNLQIRITWADHEVGYNVYASNAVAATDVTYSPVQMVCSMVRLSGEANQMVLQNTGGIFELITSDFRLARGKINTVNEKSLNVNCGFAFSSLDRVSFSFYSQLTTNTTKNRLNAQYHGDVANFALSINGEEYPRKRIDVTPSSGTSEAAVVGNPAESLAEAVIAHRSLGDWTHQSSVTAHSWCRDTSDADESASTAGTVFMIDTEAMQPHTGDTLYSGISTIGATTHLLADIQTTIINDGTSNAGKDYVVLIYGQFTTALTLDMEGTQTWIVSV